jgi:hypothetical protein
MDAVLALVTIAAMLGLASISALLLTRMFRTIRELRGVSAGLNDTMRWAVGQVASNPVPRGAPVANGPPGPGNG